MKTVYYGGDDVDAPVETKCEVMGYPNRDVDGRTMFVNSHFATPEEAWGSVIASATAELSLDGKDVMRCRSTLATAEKRLVESGLRLLRVKAAFSAMCDEADGGG